MARSKAIDLALLREWPLPVPERGAKENRGSIFVVAGSRAMPGAAMLTATAALRAGAGKLAIGTGASVATHVGAGVLESLVVGFAELPSGAFALESAGEIAQRANAADALVLGPGMVGETETCALVARAVAELDVAVVLDATALAAVDGRAELLRHLHGRAVMTPHCGEMATMLGVARDEIEGDRERFASEAAERFGCVVALKGDATYIADPGGALYCNPGGDAGLGTSGSGDVLAGIIGGLLARGASALAATAWGVFLHARAGAVLSRRIGLGFLAREILAEIPPLMRDLSA